MHEIVKWETIQGRFCHGLLLGNGASRAVHSNFGYDSLFEAATSHDYITQPVAQIFEQFGVQDFELVLRRLWQAKLVNKALSITSGQVDEAYKQVQNALISTIRDTHPTYEQVMPHLTPIYQFMQHFKTVASLNYDLIVYWATRQSVENIGNWFKDCFVKGAFIDDINTLREPYNAEGSTLFFYPHGNLVLAQTTDGREEKIAAESTNLLNTILNRWTNNDIVPLFVCEGTNEHKKLAIESASYLLRVYHEIIPLLGKSLVIYGWSMADQDQHILDQIKRMNLQRVAVSVHENNMTYAKLAHEKLYAQEVKEIIFFDAASPGCWNNSRTREA